MDCKKYNFVHDHTDAGECLVIEWKGVPEEYVKARYSKETLRKERELQTKSHKKYLKLLKQWRQERTDANVAPF